MKDFIYYSAFGIYMTFIFMLYTTGQEGNTYRYLTDSLAVQLENEAPETLIMPRRSDFDTLYNYMCAVNAFYRFHNWAQYE
jgi:hypothetical protein